MDLSKLPIFSLMTKRMAWLGKRQEVLAQNIANADTPGFKPKDLKPMDFRRYLRPTAPKVQMRMTSASHLEPMRRPARFDGATDRTTYEVAPSGNAVVLEEQLMKVAETQVDHRLITSLYRKNISLLKMAIGRDQG